MRNAALIASMCLFTLPLHAGSGPSRPQPEGPPPVFVRTSSGVPSMQAVMAKLRQDPPGASAASDNAARRAVLIPLIVNGGFPGVRQYGTAEYTLVLPRLRQLPEQRVGIYWIPAGSGEAVEGWSMLFHRPVSTTVELGWEGFTGIGAALFVALDDDGDLDPHGAIDANSRLSNFQGAGLGELSVAVPGIDAGGLFSGNQAWIYGTRTDEGYSTYYGIVNLGDADLTFDIVGDAHAGDWTEFLGRVTVPAGAMVFHRLVPSSSYTVIGLRRIGQDAATWTAYAVSTDDASGDGWYSMAAAVPPRTK
jgi:hypothetical protein